MICHGPELPRKPKHQVIDYCASNEQQGERSGAIARNLACTGLYVACADIKSAGLAHRLQFHRLELRFANQDGATRFFQCVDMDAQSNCSQTNATARLLHPGARYSRVSKMSGCPAISAEHASAINPNGSKMSGERAATFFRGNT